MSCSRNQINKFLGEIDITGKTVLDVGVQNNPARKYTKGETKKYMTLDIDNEWSPDLVLDINETDIDLSIFTNIINAQRIRGGFDIVFCLEVLEHCWNPIEAVRNLAEFTADGGVCYISVPFVNLIHDKWDMLRYTYQFFEKVLPMVGFKSVEIKRRIATVGLNDYMNFNKKEGIRMSKVTQKMGLSKHIADIGYFVIAKK